MSSCSTSRVRASTWRKLITAPSCLSGTTRARMGWKLTLLNYYLSRAVLLSYCLSRFWLLLNYYLTLAHTIHNINSLVLVFLIPFQGNQSRVERLNRSGGISPGPGTERNVSASPALLL